MNYPKRKIDLFHVQSRTDLNLRNADFLVMHVVDFLADARRKDRMEKCECRSCFYLHSGRMGGAAMCTIPCAFCEKELHFGSTCVDPICGDCGKKYELCVSCGADLHDRRLRRRLDPKVERREATLDMQEEKENAGLRDLAKRESQS